MIVSYCSIVTIFVCCCPLALRFAPSMEFCWYCRVCLLWWGLRRCCFVNGIACSVGRVGRLSNLWFGTQSVSIFHVVRLPGSSNCCSSSICSIFRHGNYLSNWIYFSLLHQYFSSFQHSPLSLIDYSLLFPPISIYPFQSIKNRRSLYCDFIPVVSRLSFRHW
jgi:hypothetical protein